MSRRGAAVAISSVFAAVAALPAGDARADSFVERPDAPPPPPPASSAAVAPAAGAAAPLDRDRIAIPESDKREHRDGLVVGMGGGWGFASSGGYPNSAQFIDVAKYHAQSGAMFGSSGTFFIEGAIADYVNFGFWFGGGTFQNGDYRSTGGGAGIRVELFPLYVLVPSLRDLGVVAQFGVSSTKLDPKHAGLNAADGTQSFLGVGAFHEWTLFHLIGGHLAAGPSLDYDVIASRSLDRGALVLGGRLAFYGGM